MHLNSQTVSCHQCSAAFSFNKHPLYQLVWCGNRTGQQGAPSLTHLLCSNTLDCLSSDTSGLKLLSLLVRLQMWLRSSCSLCLLACSSDFSLLSSCSSLKVAGKKAKKKNKSSWRGGCSHENGVWNRTLAYFSCSVCWFGACLSATSEWGAAILQLDLCFFSVLPVGGEGVFVLPLRAFGEELFVARVALLPSSSWGRFSVGASARPVPHGSRSTGLEEDARTSCVTLSTVLSRQRIWRQSTVCPSSWAPAAPFWHWYSPKSVFIFHLEPVASTKIRTGNNVIPKRTIYTWLISKSGWNEPAGQCRRLTGTGVRAGLGVNLQAWRKRALQEVHVEVIVTLHRLLYAQLKDVGEITGGVKPKINYRVSNAEGATKQRDRKQS